MAALAAVIAMVSLLVAERVTPVLGRVVDARTATVAHATQASLSVQRMAILSRALDLFAAS